MKKRWPFLLFLIILIGVGVSFHWWFPSLMGFVGANSDTIQGLSDLIQIIIWVGSAVLFWFGLLRKPKEAQIYSPRERNHNEQVNGDDIRANSPHIDGYSANADMHGDGAIVQGDGAVAVGKGGVYIGGNVKGSNIVTGNNNRLAGDSTNDAPLPSKKGKK